MNVTSDVARVPGWYGKLPSLGDFASRRLEADFIEPWDLWLGEGLQAQREHLRRRLARRLSRHAALALPALAGSDARGFDRSSPSPACWCRRSTGSAATSRSRSSPRCRAFPSSPREFDALLAWLHRLEDTALDALQGDWAIDELENALADLAPPGGEGGGAVEDRLTIVRRALADAVARRGGFVDIAGISSRADLAAIFSAPARPADAAAADARPGALDRRHAGPAATAGERRPAEPRRVHPHVLRRQRRAVGRRPPRVPRSKPDDPLATRPQGLGAPLLAAAPPARNDDLLSMFGTPAPAAPAGNPAAGRELLPDDDILALFKVGGDSASGALDQPGEVIPEHDVLGLFEPGAGSIPAEAPAQARNDDILSLFSAGETQPNEFSAEPAPANDDLLGLFEVPPQTPPFGEAPAAPQNPQAGTTEPDILDMFGVPPAKPEGKEAK